MARLPSLPPSRPESRALRAEVRVVPGSGGTVWEQVTLPSAAVRDGLDVFFAPAYTAPLRLRLPRRADHP